MLNIIINEENPAIPYSLIPIGSSFNAWVYFLECLGYPREKAPLGSLLSRYHSLPAGQWVVASPIYWEASHNDAMIQAVGEHLKLTDEQSQDYFKIIQSFVSDEGLFMHYHDTDTWLLKVQDGLACEAAHPFLLKHQSFMSYFSLLNDAVFWGRLLTEIQMLFALNHTQKRTIPFVNGVWFYGGGSFALPSDRPLFTDDQRLLAAFKGEINPLSVERFVGLSKKDKNKAIFWIQDMNKMKPFESLLALLDVTWFFNNGIFFSKKRGFINRCYSLLRR